MNKVFNNNNSHRAFLIKEMQMQVDQAIRIEKQLAIALAENDVTAICIPAIKLKDNNSRIIAVGITKDRFLKCDKLQFQCDSMDNEWVDADEFASDDFDWTELMFNTLEALEPGIMD
jgi:hypothetical protein